MKNQILKYKNIYLYGASGHGRVVYDAIKSNNFDVICFYDDNPKDQNCNNIPVVNSSEINKVDLENKLIISIGDNYFRKKISDRLDIENYAIISHIDSSISNSVKIGMGSVIFSKSVINSCANIGKHVIVNSGAIVEHDCSLGDYCHISPNAALAGNVIVEEGAQIGIGAIIIQGVKIGKWAIVGAGAVVIRDVPDYAVVVGNPSRIIKYNSLENIR
jgi:acetyltransferase EpsM